jgi:hypothetical protein
MLCHASSVESAESVLPVSSDALLRECTDAERGGLGISELGDAKDEEPTNLEALQGISAHSWMSRERHTSGGLTYFFRGCGMTHSA